MNTTLLPNNNSPLLTSQEVANMIGKEHNKLMRDIRRYISQLGAANVGHSDFFIESEYLSEQNKRLPCFNITKRGCEFIANKLTGQKGTEFTARYVNRFNELEENSTATSLVKAIQNLAEVVQTSHTELNARISKLEEATTSPVQSIASSNKRPYNPWFAKMNPKYSMLEEFYGITRGCLYKNILMEMENLYDIDTSQIMADYCYENGKDNCYPLEPYEFNHKYRNLIEDIVNNALISNGIVSHDNPLATNKHITIFDNTKSQEEK